ncbi:MAG TPA: hypothetical protein VGJ84_09035, partial [Polyangiaceae bacterium]
PVPLPLPVPAMKALLLVSFGLHILCVDVGVGGSIVCLLLAWLGRSSLPHRELARAISWVLPPAVTFAITLGVAPLLFVQVLYGRFLYSSSILMAVPWLSFILMLIVGYALLYRHADLLQKGSFSPLTGIASALLLLWLGFLWTNNATLMLRPDRWAALAAGSMHGLSLNLGDPQVLPRFLHMFLAMTAMAGLMLAVSAAFMGERAPFDRALARRFGFALFARITLVQLLVGPLIVWFQPSELRAAFLGDKFAFGAIVVGALAALSAAVTALAQRDPRGGKRGALIPFVLIHLTIAAMIILRDRVRDLSLARVGFAVETTPVSVDLGAVLAFLVAVVLLAFAWRAMLRWLFEGRGAAVRLSAHKEQVEHDA